MPDETHREIKKPQISARYLADYMAATQTAGRTIIRGCKYQPIARVVQHDEAKAAVGKAIRDGDGPEVLAAKSQALRDRLADSDFDRDVYDHNADYIDRFASVQKTLALPDADILAPGPHPPIILSGVRVTVDLAFRLRRLTKSNKIRVGVAALRYAKGKALSPSVCQWQSALLFGSLTQVGVVDGADAERQLCLTIDAYTGKAYTAPTDAVRRFQQMKSACTTIAEWWPNIPPPPSAKL
jgi:hypothetical protein